VFDRRRSQKGQPMILGMSIQLFTRLHVCISLIAIVAGMAVLLGMLTRRRFPILTAVFLITTALTSITGFMFPNKTITPGIILGILSMIVLILATAARYVGHMNGAWRGTYILCANLALWFNVFVLFAQLFEKVPELREVAPTMSSPAFTLTQSAIFILFIAVTFRAFKRFETL
jgi:hypothetical protein